MTISMKNSRMRFYYVYIDIESNKILRGGEDVEIFQYDELFIENEKIKFSPSEIRELFSYGL